MRTFTCIGPIRGSCGIHHKSIKAALQCFIRDSNGCAKVGGYSDRALVPCDGPLTALDIAEIEKALE